MDSLPGLQVIGHEWVLYITRFEGLRMYIYGPIEVARANTRTYYGTSKLLNLVQRIKVYADEVVWPWVSGNI